MLDFLKISEIVIAVLLVLIILVQSKNVTLNLSSMSGGMGEVTKRGSEKVLHNATIILGTLFIINSLVFFLYG